MPLAPRQQPHRQDQRRGDRRQRPRGTVDPRQRHGDPVASDAIVPGQHRGGVRARHQHMGGKREVRRLARRHPCRAVRLDPGFQRQRVMHQRHQRRPAAAPATRSAARRRPARRRSAASRREPRPARPAPPPRPPGRDRGNPPAGPGGGSRAPGRAGPRSGAHHRSCPRSGPRDPRYGEGGGAQGWDPVGHRVSANGKVIRTALPAVPRFDNPFPDHSPGPARMTQGSPRPAPSRKPAPCGVAGGWWPG